MIFIIFAADVPDPQPIKVSELKEVMAIEPPALGVVVVLPFVIVATALLPKEEEVKIPPAVAVIVLIEWFESRPLQDKIKSEPVLVSLGV